MSQTIRIDLSHTEQTAFRSYVILHIEAQQDGDKPAFDVDIDAATGYTGEYSSAIMQVLRSEIQAGMLMGLKQAKSKAWSISLRSLGATKDGAPAMREVPSDGFAVAASLAVAHGSGAEDLEKDPHGAYAWKLERLEIK